MRRFLTWLLLAGLTSCSPAADGAPPAPAPRTDWPPGTALCVNGEPLLAREIEALAADVALLYPGYGRLHVRRLALTNELLARLAARALAPEAWQAARAACEGFDPAQAPPEPFRVQGNFATLGLGLWSAARGLAPGEWSAPVELFGRFLRLRLEQREAADDARYERLDVALIEFPYLEAARAAELHEQALDQAALVFVDPAWREVVPEAWQLRMRPDRP